MIQEIAGGAWDLRYSHHFYLYHKLYLIWLFGILVWFMWFASRTWWLIGPKLAHTRRILEQIATDVQSGQYENVSRFTSEIPQRYIESGLREMKKSSATISAHECNSHIQKAATSFNLGYEALSNRVSKLSTAAGVLTCSCVIFAFCDASTAFYEMSVTNVAGFHAVVGWLSELSFTLTISVGMISAIYLSRRHFVGRLRRRRENWNQFLAKIEPPLGE